MHGMHPVDRFAHWVTVRHGKKLAAAGLFAIPVALLGYGALFATAAAEWPTWAFVTVLLSHAIVALALAGLRDLRSDHWQQSQHAPPEPPQRP